MSVLYLGIDPGVSGGIAAVNTKGQYAGSWKMPGDAAGLLAMLWALDRDHERFAVLERVRSSPQMGVVSAFTFGRGYGRLEMVLAATGIAYREVTPQQWQTAMTCRTHGDKNISKARAAHLFPNVKITHSNADSLLLAEYCRRLRCDSRAKTTRPE